MTTFFQYQERIGLIWCKQIEGSERHRSESRLCQSLIESWLYRLPPAWLVELHYRQHPSQLELCYQLAVWTSDPNPKMNVEKPRRRLAPSEKYEIYVAVLTGQTTQREAAERFGVDRSTVVQVCRTAKQGALAALAASVPGRPRQSLEAAALEATRAEVERCGPPSPSRWWRCTCAS
jgi:transposase-like protein